MTTPSNAAIVQQVAATAAFFDEKAPGWAQRVPLTEVDIMRVERSPLAYIIGLDWDTKIEAKSAIGMMASTLYSSVAEVANPAWQRQIAIRRTFQRQAS